MDLAHLAAQLPAPETDLDTLQSSYRDRGEDALLEASKEVVKVNAGTLMMALKATEGYTAIRRSFRFRFPGVPPQQVLEGGVGQLRAFALLLRPTFFEYLVMERLNRGERLGNVALRAGDRIRWKRGDPSTWSLVALRPDGTYNGALSRHLLKEMGYIRQALVDYPDLQVITEDEEEAVEEVHKEILREFVDYDGNIVERGLGVAARGLTHLGHGLGVVGGAIAPAIPALVLAVAEGQAFLCGRTDYQHATMSLAGRAGKTATLGGLAATLLIVDLGLVTGPLVAAAKTQWTRMETRRQLRTFLRPRTQELIDLIEAFDLDGRKPAPVAS